MNSQIKHKSIEEILRQIILETENMCGLTITDSLGVDVTSGLIQYMKQGFRQWLTQFQNVETETEWEVDGLDFYTIFENLKTELRK